MPAQSVDEYPSLLWVTIPPVLLFSAYFIRKWYLARNLRVHGIGKGAPGFQTNVRKIRVTPEIAARIRRGEEVSPEEIAAASAKAEEMAQRGDIVEKRLDLDSSPVEEPQTSSQPMNEWLPENLSTPKKRGKGKRK